MGQIQSNNDLEVQFSPDKPYSEVKIEKLSASRTTLRDGIISRELLSNLTNKTLVVLLKNHVNTERVEIYIEDVPFHQGKEFYFFKGFQQNSTTDAIEDKVLKLAKYKEISVENLFVTQKIAAFLANEFSKKKKTLILINQTCFLNILFC